MADSTNGRKVALITGVTGQDGSYLAEFLLGKGYIVHGIKRRSSSFNTGRIDHIYQDPHVDGRDFILHYGDLTDSTNLIRIVQEAQPDEIYNLGAQSHVAVSFEEPEYTANADGVGRCGCWRRSGFWGCRRRRSSIRRRRRSCTGWCRRFRKPSGRRFTRARRMRRPSCTRIGSR